MTQPRRCLLFVVMLIVLDGAAVQRDVHAKEPRKLEGHDKAITALAFAPDGKILATGSSDGKICLWDTATDKVIFRLEGDKDCVYAVAFAPDSKLLATAGTGNLVIVWNPGTGKEVRRLKGHEDKIAALAFSSDGKLLASGGYDKSIRLWNPATGQEVRQLKEHEGRVTALVFSPDSKTLASGGTGHATIQVNGNIVGTSQADTIHLWELTGKTPAWKLTCRASNIAFSPDGKTLAGGGMVADIQRDQGGTSIDGHDMISIIDVATGKEIRQIKWRGSAVVFSPDGKTIASGMGSLLHFADFGIIGPNGVNARKTDYRARLWEVATGKEILKLPEEKAVAIAFSPDGKTLATGNTEGLVRLWDIEAEKRDPTPDPREVIRRPAAEDKLLNRLDADFEELLKKEKIQAHFVRPHGC